MARSEGERPQEGRGSIRERIELFSAVLLAAATVATAYSAYEATRWSGVQAIAFTEASAKRTASAKAQSDGFSLVSIDADLFTEYAVAFSEGNEDLGRALRTRFFRDEFLPAFRAWVEQEPLENPDAAENPFTLEEYRPQKLVEADRLEREADAKFDEGTEANQTSDHYVLATIFFAAVLFFAGLASKFRSDRVALGALAFGTVVFLAGIARLVTLPFH